MPSHFFFNDTATTEIYTLSLHDALPISKGNAEMVAAAIRTVFAQPDADHVTEQFDAIATMLGWQMPKVEAQMRDAKDDLLEDRKSTRLNSSHANISYAVFCLKKKKMSLT